MDGICIRGMLVRGSVVVKAESRKVAGSSPDEVDS
jgi:hypothetical protein